MAASVPRKALIAITSSNGVFYADGKRTGLFFTEANPASARSTAERPVKAFDSL